MRSVAFLLVALMALLVGRDARGQEPEAQTTIGIEGRVVLEHELPQLQVVEARDDAVLLLRLGEVEFLEDGRQRVELLFLARRPGDFDLRQYLTTPSGKPPQGLPSIPIRVTSLLPEDHQGDLESIEELEGPGAGGFYRIVKVVLVLWLLPMGAWLFWRWRSRPRPEPVVVERKPTVAELLRPLADAALRGELDLAGQAKLERLLLGFWRDRLGLGDLSQADALRRMRAHEEAGELLRAVEAWLHRPDGQETVTEGELQRLLRRYQTPMPQGGQPT